ncbi:hypothetical protein FRIGORI9N_60002 [Frigoribacterium sp. 9N]|nr:hypothetical protein FRIGORI9N_60002 [Frigoribacterium sp. 9N]
MTTSQGRFRGRGCHSGPNVSTSAPTASLILPAQNAITFNSDVLHFRRPPDRGSFTGASLNARLARVGHSCL